MWKYDYIILQVKIIQSFPRKEQKIRVMKLLGAEELGYYNMEYLCYNIERDIVRVLRKECSDIYYKIYTDRNISKSYCYSSSINLLILGLSRITNCGRAKLLQCLHKIENKYMCNIHIQYSTQDLVETIFKISDYNLLDYNYRILELKGSTSIYE